MAVWNDQADESAGEHAGSGLAGRAEPRSYRLEDQVWLQRAIETELVPRLMLAHRSDPPRFPDVRSPAARMPTPDEILTLADRLILDDENPSRQFVMSFSEREISLSDVMLGLLSPAARELGTRWEADECDFGAVTLGLWRIHTLVHELNLNSPSPLEWGAATPGRILIAVVPGSDHTLGALMLSEFFRRAGWDVWYDPDATLETLKSAVGADHFDLIGLSASRDVHLKQLPSIILSLRRASRNPATAVMVGGPSLLKQPQQALQLGADLTAADASEALYRAREWVLHHRRDT